MAFKIQKFFTKYIVHVLAYQSVMLAILSLALATLNDASTSQLSPINKRSSSQPSNPLPNSRTSQKCYDQERTAMFLALFLGTFGVDQFYAHHWVLATFKMLTLGGCGLWSLIDMCLWISGGIYGTPGCEGYNGI